MAQENQNRHRSDPGDGSQKKHSDETCTPERDSEVST
jgi:hypothetical protein